MSIYKLADLSRFPDCSGLSENGKCTRLAFYSCQGEVCTFKRSLEEDIDSLQYAYKLLSSLDIPMQEQIAKKYYGGSMPWNEE
jgi:hypothetical protein